MFLAFGLRAGNQRVVVEDSERLQYRPGDGNRVVQRERPARIEWSIGDGRKPFAECDARRMLNFRQQAGHDIVEQGHLLAIKLIGTGDKQIRDPPENIGPRTDIFLLDRDLKLIHQGFMARPNLLRSRRNFDSAGLLKALTAMRYYAA